MQQSNQQFLATDTCPPVDLVKLLIENSGQISVVPDVANQALELTNDVECSLEHFASLVQQDVKLASELLIMANSSSLGLKTRVASIQEAAGRLGLRKCKHLIIGACMSSMMKNVSLRQAWIRDLLWRHSITTATLASELNRRLNLGFDGTEFTAGLLHDIGRVLLAATLPTIYADIDPLDFAETPEILARESSLAGTSHAEFGAWFLAANNLPEELVESTRFHHEPQLAQENPRLVALINIADDMANHVQRGEKAETYDFHTCVGIQLFGTLGCPKVEEKLFDIAPELLHQASENIDGTQVFDSNHKDDTWSTTE